MALDSGGQVDRQALMAKFGNDRQLLAELVEALWEEMPRRLSSLEEALASGDAKALFQAAHAIKGAVSNFEAQSATQAAFHLETLGREERLSDAPSALLVLKRQLDYLVEDLQGLLEG